MAVNIFYKFHKAQKLLDETTAPFRYLNIQKSHAKRSPLYFI